MSNVRFGEEDLIYPLITRIIFSPLAQRRGDGETGRRGDFSFYSKEKVPQR